MSRIKVDHSQLKSVNGVVLLAVLRNDFVYHDRNFSFRDLSDLADLVTVVVQQGQSYIFNGQLNSSNFTGSISTSSATSPFFTFSAVKERAQNGSYVYRDAGRNLIIAVDGQNVLGLFYNNGSSWVRAGRIGL